MRHACRYAENYLSIYVNSLRYKLTRKQKSIVTLRASMTAKFFNNSVSKLALSVVPLMIPLCFLALGARADNPLTYSVQLNHIDGTSLFALTPTNPNTRFSDTQNYFRLWGTEVFRRFPESVTQQVFECAEVGYFYALGYGRGRIIQCNNSETDLTGYAIDNKYGTEICSETGNSYGTCMLEGLER